MAAAYGCTPANIYTILARLRRQGAQEARKIVSSASAAEAGPAALLVRTPPQPTCSVSWLRRGRILPLRLPRPARTGAAGDGARQPPAARGYFACAAACTARITRPARSGRVEAVPRSPLPSPTPRVGKAGYALLMRTSDGEEAVSPFRSLNEPLSAAKPILRTAARSPEPIWFSIQQVDLETLEDDF